MVTIFTPELASQLLVAPEAEQDTMCLHTRTVRRETSDARLRGAIAGGLVGVAVGVAAHAAIAGHHSRAAQVGWTIGLGVLASAVANVLTKHTGIA